MRRRIPAGPLFHSLRRSAGVLLACGSVFLLATCDLDKLGPVDSTGPNAPLTEGDITISGATSVNVGGTVTLALSSVKADLSDVLTLWRSTNPAIATVDEETGVVTGVGVGSTTIIGELLAPELGKPIEKQLAVTVRFAGIKITSPSASPADSLTGLGQTRTVAVFGTNVSGTTVGGALNTGLSLSSSNTSVFTVSGSTITATGNGTARIVAVFDSRRDSILVKVRQVAKSITFNPTDYVTGSTNTNLPAPTLTAIDVQNAAIASPTITWRSADTNRVTINATTGIVRLKVADTARIFAKVDTVERSQKVVFLAPPAAPTSLIATTSSNTQINLSWTDNASNETGFTVERCLGVSCTNFVEVGTTTTNVTTFASTGLTGSTTYRFRVAAVNAGSVSAYTNIASATTDPNPPSAPSNLVATAVSSTQINLTWTDNANNETGFSVRRCTGSTCTNFLEFASVSSNSGAANSIGLTPSTTYRFQVVAFNAGGNSAGSNIVAEATLSSLPDLIMTDFTAPTVVPIGGTIQVSMTHRNIGGVAAGAFQSGIYFSTNSIISTGDIASSSFCPATSLAVLTSASCAGAASVPSNLTSGGTYFVGGFADNTFVVSEANEGNNATASPIQVLAKPIDLVVNGDFNFVAVAWQQFFQALVLTNSALSFSASNYLSMLTNSSGTGLDNSTGRAFQDIAIPAGITSATLDFRYNITTQETTTLSKFDSLVVTIRNTSGTQLASVVTFSNLDKHPGTGAANYSLRSHNMTPFIGQTVRIQFEAFSDVTLPTIFRIDDVRLLWVP